MGTGYTRNDTVNNIADGNVINASDLDGEFDAIQSAFNGSTGHSHDGTTGEGPQIDTAGLADGAVTNGKLGADAVTGAKIADDTIDSEHYVAGSIDNEHLANDAVTGAKIDETTTITAAGFVGPLTGNVTGNVTGNAGTATALETSRTLGVTLTGDVTGSGTAGFDGTGNATISFATTYNNDVVLGTDTSGNYVATVSTGTGLTGTGSGEGSTPTLSLSHLGFQNLTDPNADRVAFWDDSAGAFAWLAMGTNLSISGTTLNATDTNTTYSAGSGLDLSGTTFSVEPDLRDGITHIGVDTTDYIQFTNNTRIDFYVNNGNEFRMESDGDFHADGDVIAYSTTISDARLKQNVQGIENAVAKVGQLNGYTFEYIKDGKVSAGVIAQEVEKVLPEAVSEKLLPLKTDDGQEYKVVNYDALHGLLIEAIKELTARIEVLEAK